MAMNNNCIVWIFGQYFRVQDPKNEIKKNDQKCGACTRRTVTVAKKSAYMTRIDPAMDNNCIVWLFGQYFCVQDPKNEIKKIDQKYGACTRCTVTVAEKSA